MNYVIHLFCLFLGQKVFVESQPRYMLSVAPLHLYPGTVHGHVGNTLTDMRKNDRLLSELQARPHRPA